MLEREIATQRLAADGERDVCAFDADELARRYIDGDGLAANGEGRVQCRGRSIQHHADVAAELNGGNIHRHGSCEAACECGVLHHECAVDVRYAHESVAEADGAVDDCDACNLHRALGGLLKCDVGGNLNTLEGEHRIQSFDTNVRSGGQRELNTLCADVERLVHCRSGAVHREREVAAECSARRGDGHRAAHATGQSRCRNDKRAFAIADRGNRRRAGNDVERDSRADTAHDRRAVCRDLALKCVFAFQRLALDDESRRIDTIGTGHFHAHEWTGRNFDVHGYRTDRDDLGDRGACGIYCDRVAGVRCGDTCDVQRNSRGDATRDACGGEKESAVDIGNAKRAVAEIERAVCHTDADAARCTARNAVEADIALQRLAGKCEFAIQDFEFRHAIHGREVHRDAGIIRVAGESERLADDRAGRVHEHCRLSGNRNAVDADKLHEAGCAQRVACGGADQADACIADHHAARQRIDFAARQTRRSLPHEYEQIRAGKRAASAGVHKVHGAFDGDEVADVEREVLCEESEECARSGHFTGTKYNWNRATIEREAIIYFGRERIDAETGASADARTARAHGEIAAQESRESGRFNEECTLCVLDAISYDGQGCVGDCKTRDFGSIREHGLIEVEVSDERDRADLDCEIINRHPDEWSRGQIQSDAAAADGNIFEHRHGARIDLNADVRGDGRHARNGDCRICAEAAANSAATDAEAAGRAGDIKEGGAGNSDLERCAAEADADAAECQVGFNSEVSCERLTENIDRNGWKRRDEPHELSRRDIERNIRRAAGQSERIGDGEADGVQFDFESAGEADVWNRNGDVSAERTRDAAGGDEEVCRRTIKTHQAASE